MDFAFARIFMNVFIHTLFRQDRQSKVIYWLEKRKGAVET